jgi:hypothetical protein
MLFIEQGLSLHKSGKERFVEYYFKNKEIKKTK